MAKLQLELPDNTLELLFLNRISTSPSHTLAFTQIFDERWISDKSVQLLCRIIFTYFRKTNKLPSFDIIAQFLTKLSEKKPIDIDEVKTKFEYATNLTFDDAVTNDSLLDFIKRKGLYFAILDNLDLIEAKRDVSNILSVFSNILNVSIDQDLGVNWFDDLEAHFSKIKEKSAKISTGYAEFDNEFNGGILKDGKMIWVPVGMPGIGKTAFIMNLGLNFIPQNKKVCIITMEINEQLYLQRIDALATSIEISSIPYQEGVAFKKIRELAEKYPQSGIVVKEFPPKSVNTAVIANYIDRIILGGFKPDVIIVDYLNLALPATSGSKETMYERVGGTAQEFRALSYRFAAPFIVPTQFNTEGYDNIEPTMANIAESRAVAHHADVVTSIWQGENDRENNIINFKNLKNRLGGKIGKKLSLRINYNTLRLTSLGKTEQSASQNNITANVVKGLDTM